MRRGRERGDRQSKAEDPAATVSRDLIRGANNLARPCALPERNGCLSVYRRHDETRIKKEALMGRGILLWLLGVPIPIIILIALLYH